MENRPLDLWTIFRFLMPGLLDSRASLEDASRDDSSALLKRLRRQIKPFLLRRTKAKVATELPPRTDVVLHCALTPRQETLYRQWTEEGIRKLENKQGRTSGMHVFALMTRLRQVCCDPSLLPGMAGSYEHSTKLRMLQEKLEEALASGAKVVVFSQFVTFLNRIDTMLRHCFPDTPLFQLTGKTRDRAVPVEGFRKQSGSAVFLVSLKAGGTGLNLQMADYVFLMDPWWNPAVEAQAVDRVHRLGQKKRVFIYRLVTRGTLEERIEKLKDQKTEVFQELMQGMARGIGQREYLNQIDDWLRYQSPEG
jgi:SNF2 family DNA or RNA helicase